MAMTVYRFFGDPSMVRDDRIVLSGDTGRHSRVVRLKPGEMFEVVASGSVYCAVVDSVLPAGVTGKIVSSKPVAHPPYEVHLFAGMLRGPKMDLVVEKATELGVASITPVICSRTVLSPDESGWRRRIERWRRIAVSAAEQSRRNCLPEVRYPVSFGEMKELAARGFAKSGEAELVMAWEGLVGAPSPLHGMLKTRKKVGVLVGPEGGFSELEVSEATAAGFKPVSLGPHVLRAETACITAVGLMVFLLEAAVAGTRPGRSFFRG